MKRLDDETYMRLALQLAEAAKGQTGPNPAVGCVVVKDGRIIGMGSHLQAGKEHAEVHALNMADDEAEGSTVYVTLEPCSHFGRTPPCCKLLIERKVARVVVAALDPNPQVSGRGIERLKQHGIQTETGLLAGEAEQILEPFRKFITTGLPFVTLKTASTLDGKIASKTGDSKWITGPDSRACVHVLRHQHQAIMVGVETVLQDDPLLTARLTVPALQPLRVIADSKLRTPIDAAVVQDKSAPTLICTTSQAPEQKRKALEDAGVEVAVCGSEDRVDLHEMMKLLADKQISTVLLEGGGRLNGAMLSEGLVDKVILFFAPKIIGGKDAPSNFSFEGMDRIEDAIMLERVRTEMFGDDVCITGYPRKRRKV